MAESSENETRGLNALGNPDRQIRTGTDRGPEGDVRGVGSTRPGGILTRGTASSMRKGMALARGDEQLRNSSR